MDINKAKPVAPMPATLSEEGGARVVSTQHLMAGDREVVLRHAGEDYRLRITRLNKLILTK